MASGDAELIFMAGGGTGGHLFPGLALARALTGLRSGLRIEFIGARGGMDGDIVGPTEFPLRALAVGRGSPLSWRRPLNAPRFVWSLGQCRRLFRSARPRAVVGLGGFAAAAPGLMARWTRTPLFLFEPNAVPGRVNRWLAGWARGVFIQFDAARERFGQSPARIALTGSPLRPELEALADKAPAAGDAVVVVGGSQGARRLNDLFVEGAGRVAAAGARIVHIAGAAHVERVREGYRAQGLADRVEVLDFCGDMAGLLRRAGLVVARSGAGSLSEFAVAGTPAVLLPLSTAMDDHQRANANVVAANGGAVVLDERTLAGADLGDAVADLWRDPAARRRMGEAMRAHAHPRAAAEAAKIVLETM